LNRLPAQAPENPELDSGSATALCFSRPAYFIKRNIGTSVMQRRLSLLLAICLLTTSALATNIPARAPKGMVVSANASSSAIGRDILTRGGNAIDAAIAVAFSLAVTHPTAGNIGGGGFLIHQQASGAATAYDFRETAPAASHPEMFMIDGKYRPELHHSSHLAVGVPGTVAGLYMAWQDGGSLPWKDLVTPAIAQARDGIVVTDGLARSLNRVLPRMEKYPASIEKFTNADAPMEPGQMWHQPDLAASLQRIADEGPDGFYKGKTADLIVAEMKRGGGIITHEDLAAYKPQRRTPIRGTYRGYEILSMPPPSSGGVTLIQMLNILEGFDIAASGFGSADTLHLMAESMRRAYADRARYLGDPDFVEMPLQRLASKEYAAQQRKSIREFVSSGSSPESFTWPPESMETTHFSVIDAERNAVSLTYTLEYSYGSGIVVRDGGFLLNNEMGDFNAGPGLTDASGLIGTPANLAAPGKRMLSSMTPTIINKDGKVFMVTGTPGGRTIINTVLQTILNVIDHNASAQAAVDLGRIHHQWLPDVISYEKLAFSPDTIANLRRRGHAFKEVNNLGVAEVIVVREDGLKGWLEGGVDRRQADGGAAGY
jgi:gamma-glutamyltranspeptidase/glutathione hydrolase